jgi:hypothetical protein
MRFGPGLGEPLDHVLDLVRRSMGAHHDQEFR